MTPGSILLFPDSVCMYSGCCIAHHPNPLPWLTVTTVIMWSDSSGGKNIAIRWVKEGREKRESQSFAILSSLPLTAISTQPPLSHEILHKQWSGQSGNGTQSAPTQAPTKEASHLLPVLNSNPHSHNLTRNSYYSSQRVQARQSAPVLPWSWWQGGSARAKNEGGIREIEPGKAKSSQS